MKIHRYGTIYVRDDGTAEFCGWHLGGDPSGELLDYDEVVRQAKAYHTAQLEEIEKYENRQRQQQHIVDKRRRWGL